MGKVSPKPYYPELYDKHWVRREYVDNARTLLNIAQELGCSAWTVSNALRRYDIEPRRTGPVGHGHTEHGHPTPTYRSWQMMKLRCTDPNHVNWQHYGGRGITVCDTWLHSFDAFLADMGVRPEWANGGLDRIDNDKGYEKSNCRWATKKQQANNRR